MRRRCQQRDKKLMEKRNEEEDRGEKDDLRMRGWLVVEETWRKIEKLRLFWINVFSAVNLCLLLCKASLVTVDVLGNVADELRTSEVPVQKDDTR